MLIFAAVAFLGGTVPTQTAQARDYYDDDDIWDLMNPAWWAEEMFDDDDDDWWYYRQHLYNPYWGGPYWGGPYRRHPQVIVIQPESETTEQNPETRLPE